MSQLEHTVDTFDGMSKRRMYEILSMRAKVFVVEQGCPYLDPDGLDYDAYHLCAMDGEEYVGYLRFYREGDGFTIGRVLSLRRREGIATAMLGHAISFIRGEFGMCDIRVEAESYAEALYAKWSSSASEGRSPSTGYPTWRWS